MSVFSGARRGLPATLLELLGHSAVMIATGLAPSFYGFSSNAGSVFDFAANERTTDDPEEATTRRGRPNGLASSIRGFFRAGNGAKLEHFLAQFTRRLEK
jgi:hypothetical protein